MTTITKPLDNVLRNIVTILGSLINTIGRACGKSHCQEENLHFDLLLSLHLMKLRFWNLKWQSSWFATANRMKEFLIQSNCQNCVWNWKSPRQGHIPYFWLLVGWNPRRVTKVTWALQVEGPSSYPAWVYALLTFLKVTSYEKTPHKKSSVSGWPELEMPVIEFSLNAWNTQDVNLMKRRTHLLNPLAANFAVACRITSLQCQKSNNICQMPHGFSVQKPSKSQFSQWLSPVFGLNLG